MIFISYSSKDGKLAGTIKAELEAKHYACFLAHDDIKAHADWHSEIWKQLRGSTAFIGLVTNNFNDSAFCQQEVGAAFALNKPALLVLISAVAPPGFASRFQAIKRKHLHNVISEHGPFRPLRVGAWIRAAGEVGNFDGANAAHDMFSSEWDKMSNDEKLHWLLAAASNSQVHGERFRIGKFFARKKTELKPLLTMEWLFDNDKSGVLHDFDNNPVAKRNDTKSSRNLPYNERISEKGS